MKKALLIFIILPLVGLQTTAAGQRPEPAFRPLPITAHAHNDYQHQHPLWDALHFGFRSIEVDVCLVNGVFHVAHDTDGITPTRTLCALYIDPLLELIISNGGHVLPDGSEFILLIDIKTDATEGWCALQKLLSENEVLRESPVKILVSGNRDLENMDTSSQVRAEYDGRLPDLQDHPELPIITLISANWTEEFEWAGQGIIPANDLLKLRNIVSAAHAQGRKVRFWATDFPGSDHQEEVWKRLLAEGVDVIGTDKLAAFNKFMNQQDEE